MKQNINTINEKLKKNIEILINNNLLEEAYDLIKEYKKINLFDSIIATMEATILYMQNKINDAKMVLMNAKKIEENNFEIVYNLAFIHNECQEYDKALEFYIKSFELCNDENLKKSINEEIKLLKLNIRPDKIKKVLFIQNLQCIRTYKVAKVLKKNNIQVDLVYLDISPEKVYKELDLPYTNIYKLSDINSMIRFINESDYDILYSSNEPDYLTVLFTATNKPIVHDTHDMMSLRGNISDEQIVLEYIANKNSSGNVYVTEYVKNIAINKFDLNNKEIIVYNNYPLVEQLPNKFYEKISKKDNQIHCVYEGGVSNIVDHHRNLENMFLSLAKQNIHVHFYAQFNSDYYKELDCKSEFIHYEGECSPNELINELTKYDIGLALLNITDRNRTFLDTTFPNKVWEYLSAGLPIAFSDLKVFSEFVKENNVGSIIDFNKNLKQQFENVKNISIDNNFILKKNFIMDSKASEIINFLYNVKIRYYKSLNYEAKKTQIEAKTNIIRLMKMEKFEEALLEINEYNKNFNKNDVDIIYYEALIYIQNNNIEKAENIIRINLENESGNFKLFYAVASISEMKNEYILAKEYYKRCISMIKDENKVSEIKKIINNLSKKIKLDEENQKNKYMKNSKFSIFRTLYSVYITEFINKFNKYYGTKFDLFTFDSEYLNQLSENNMNEVFILNDNVQLLQKEVMKMKYYDIINIHYVTPSYYNFIDLIRKKCNKLIVTVWGSDFYRSNNETREIQRAIFSKADIITFDNDETMNEFIKYYGEDYRNRSVINLFGLTTLEYINNIKNISKNEIKKRYSIKNDEIVVTCGYNATEAHNHLTIINSIMKSSIDKSKIVLILPMTYGRDENYINKVIKKLNESKLKYIILNDFMNFSEVAEITKITDIMIQVQTTDTLSASMQEQLYCGNIIITGKWLPYKMLRSRGIYWLEVDKVEDVGKVLTQCLKSPNEIRKLCIKNSSIIRNLSCWENTIKKWETTFTKEIGIDEISTFNLKDYWDQRYAEDFTIQSSGYKGLGNIYNKYLYKARLDVLSYVENNLIKTFKGKNIIEFGCGTGVFTHYFYNKNLNDYTGIELSEIAVNNLKKIYKDFKFINGNIIDRINYEHVNKNSDIIFSAEVLMHIIDDNDLRKVIRNIKSIMKDDGYFIQFDPICLSKMETKVEYMKFINFNNYKNLLDKEGMEIVGIIPLAFFMDQPFDYNIFEDGKVFNDIFYLLKQYFSTTKKNDLYLNELSEVIYKLDHLLCRKFNLGMTQKALIIRKKLNCNKSGNIIEAKDVWNCSELKKGLKEKIKYVIKESDSNEIIEIIMLICNILNITT